MAIAMAALCSIGSSLGILVVRQPQFSPIQLGDAQVSVDIANNIARTRVKQDFYNPNPRQLEADFYFPVPRGANVTDFVLYIDGKPTRGEVLEKDKARETYEGIVRRMQDPGLLEWIDYNLFKVRVFPVPAGGTQKIEIEFAQPLEADQGMFKYVLPLKSTSKFEEAGRKPTVQFDLEIKSDEPVRNVYSPSHPVSPDYSDPKDVKVKIPAGAISSGGGNFTLFYQASAKDVALSLLATRASASQDGFFSLMLSPAVDISSTSNVTPMDVNFVIDTSGSMQSDNKIEQARRALTYCISKLRDSDRFALTRFSTEVERFNPELMPASQGNLEQAKHWISQLEARGGTNIGEALNSALTIDRGTTGTATGRIYTVVFITDGLPTIGNTSIDSIASDVAGKASRNVRVFTFGVGNDVNTKLLDTVADATRAASDYIKPGEDLEVPVSRFFDKISKPALVDLKIEIPGAEVYDVYPHELPDLFFGTQLTVFGRYKKAGSSAITLKGSAAGKPQKFVYEKNFPEVETQNSFVENLWGTRKIAYLLSEIKAHGENSESRDEVIRLAKKYGVVTPYTSYLVAEDVPHQQTADASSISGIQRTRAFRSNRGDIRKESQSAFGLGLPSDALYARKSMVSRDKSAAPAAAATSATSLQPQSGQAAVDYSKRLAELKTSSVIAPAATDSADIRYAAGKSFSLVDGVWVDSELKAGDKPDIRIKYLSDAYFALLRQHPELKDVLSLGSKVRVKLTHSIIEVGESGMETPPEEGFAATM
jgi:Ca-activated chloride channel family protein